MSTSSLSESTRRLGTASGRRYYGWTVLCVAALGMVATLPGRTQGLGLITEPLLLDLKRRLRVVKQGRDGLLYLLTDEEDAVMLRIEPAE